MKLYIDLKKHRSCLTLNLLSKAKPKAVVSPVIRQNKNKFKFLKIEQVFYLKGIFHEIPARKKWNSFIETSFIILNIWREKIK